MANKKRVKLGIDVSELSNQLVQINIVLEFVMEHILLVNIF